MSFVDAPSRWSTLAHNSADNLPRLALLALVAMAWVTTLAWPPAPAHIQPPIAPADAGRPGYPLRVELPAAEPVPMDELAELVKENENLARLDLDLSGTRGRSNGPDGGPGSPVRGDAKFAAIPDLKSGEFLSLDYDLAALEPVPEKFDANDGSLTVKKPLYVDGASAGSATIRIEEGAQILIATSAVAKALGSRAQSLPPRIAGALAKGTGYIPFHELRGAGIAVEYDPVADRVSLSMPS
ncbi:MAG: hypothetical protein APF82_01900 [Sphingomonadales bacterium BRH_c42]|nr:MAG: hypothetical protein APF82_01900 [Sphingomonadales bacterium BRH_c42]